MNTMGLRRHAARKWGRPGMIIRIVAGALLAATVVFAAWRYKDRLTARPHTTAHLSYQRLGLDSARVNADALIASVALQAQRSWEDSSWWSVRIAGVRGDGTVDLTGGARANVTYVSPWRASSASPAIRRKAIQRFEFSGSGVNARELRARKSRTSWQPPPAPQCSITNLAASLVSRGLAPDDTIDVSFNPSIFRHGLNWRVQSSAELLSGFYSMADCSLVRPAA